MNNFVNGYRLCLKNDRSEFVVGLVQTSPDLMNVGTDNETDTTELVGSFVMNIDFARNLAAKILEMVDRPAENPVTENAASE